MNKDRRNQLQDAITHLEEAKEIIESVAEQERDAFDNLPESIQYSERGETMEENADDLEGIDLDEAIDTINEVISR